MSIYIYYVYAYIRKNDGTPYYIGKGKDNRAYNDHGKLPVPKDKSRIVFLETNLSEVGALALERRYIRWYGRKDNHTGILRNLTDGGEGCSGMIHSDETKQKRSIANKGMPNPRKGMPSPNKGRPAHNKGKPGMPHSEEAKQKISIANKGKPSPKKGKPGMPCSEEAKQKISIANKGKPSPKKGMPAHNKGKPISRFTVHRSQTTANFSDIGTNTTSIAQTNKSCIVLYLFNWGREV